MTRYEYGILRNSSGAVHRSGMTEEEAWSWLNTFFADGGLPSAFSVIRREVLDWQIDSSDD